MSITLSGNLFATGKLLVDSSGAAPTGDIVITFAEFNPAGMSGGQNIEDPEGVFNSPASFAITGANGSGVQFTNLTSENNALFAANAYSTGYIWNATWTTGSTYVTTPVAMYAAPGNATFWILNPSDTSAPVPGGTFILPVSLVSTTTPTSFHN